MLQNPIVFFSLFQACNFQFIPWAYNIYEIQFNIINPKCNLGLYVANGAWDLYDTDIYVDIPSVDLQVLTIRLFLSRRPSFYLVNMVLPIATMGVLNLLVFLLPPESGERVGYCITVLLAICVFLTIAADNLPKASYPSMSVLCIKLFCDMIISSCVLFFVVLGLRFYHKDDDEPVPRCLGSFAECVLCRCCKQKKKRNKHDHAMESTNKLNREKRQPVDCDRDVIGNDFHVNHGTKLPRIYMVDHEDERVHKSQKKKRITWTDVGTASDVAFFVFSLAAFVASQLTYVVYLNI